MAPTPISSSTTGAGGRASDRGAEDFHRPPAGAGRRDHHGAVVRRRVEAEPDPGKGRDRRSSSMRPRTSPPTARRSTSPTAPRSCGSTARPPPRSGVSIAPSPRCAACRMAASRSRWTGARCRCSRQPSAPSATVTFSDPSMHAINALAPGPGEDAGRHRRLDGAPLPAMGARSDGARPHRARACPRPRERQHSHAGFRAALCVRRLRRGQRPLRQRKLEAPRDRLERGRQPAHGAGPSAGLSFAAVAGCSPAASG